MAEELKNQEVNEEVNQENTTPEESKQADEPTRESVFSKLKIFGSTKVVPAVKATGKIVGKMAIITGGVLGAVATVGFVAGMTVRNQNEEAEEAEEEVDESISGGDEEIDELLEDSDDSEDEDSVE